MLKIVFEKIWEDSLPLRWSLFITSLVVGIPWLVVITFKENSIWFAYLLCFLVAFIIVARFVLYVGEIVDHIKSHLTKRPPDKGGRRL